MRFVLFPYERVAFGARVVIYGMGFCGRQFVQQLAENHYCEVVFAVDRENTRKSMERGVEVLPLTALKERENEYDIVVIALLDADEAERVRQSLMAHGVSEGKIITTFHIMSVEDVAAVQSQLMQLRRDVADNARFMRRWLWDTLCGLESYAHNDFLMRYCPGWNESALVEKMRSVMELLKVRTIVQDHHLVRVGNEADGGYVIVDNYPQGGDKILYSFGVGGDVTFEYDLAQRGYECYMYDHTVSGLPQQHERFHYEKKGIAGIPDPQHPELETLPNLLKQNGHGKKREMLLKMDVEGAEVEVFQKLPEGVADRFAQIIMEIHGFSEPERWDGLMMMLAKLNRTHQLVHMHLNNNWGLRYFGDRVIGYGFEVTYVRKRDFSFRDQKGCLQGQDDRRCSAQRGEWFAFQR